jgi:hypothetical protein
VGPYALMLMTRSIRAELSSAGSQSEADMRRAAFIAPDL